MTPDDADGLDGKYKCLYCKLLLRDAMQTGTCGHFYCQTCVNELLVVDGDPGALPAAVCVVDSQRIPPGQMFADQFMRREINGLVVHCAFAHRGCTWKGEVKHLELHGQACGHAEIECGHCRVVVVKAAYAAHMENDCPYRKQACPFCETRVPANEMQSHQDDVCPSVPVDCDKCRQSVPRAQLAEHVDLLAGDCSGVDRPCPFAALGCPENAPVTALRRADHVGREQVAHGVLLVQCALRLGQQLEALTGKDCRALASKCGDGFAKHYEGLLRELRDRLVQCTDDGTRTRETLEEQRQRILALERRTAAVETAAAKQLFSPPPAPPTSSSSSGASTPHAAIGATALPLEAVARIEKKLENLDNRTADHEVLLVENNRCIEEKRRDIGEQKRLLETTRETARRLERRIESIEHTLALRNVTLADLEEYVRQQEFSSYDGQLVWRVSDYARRRNDAVTGQQVSFYSSCFYTSRYGYKMCCRLYLNGDGMGRGTHISIFFTIMRGQYDGLLRWPFRQKVTFMLLDQDNVEHVIDAFRPDPSSSSFQRPRRETNIASGCPMFCALTELNNHPYVRDDVMYLKIIVDTTDL